MNNSPLPRATAKHTQAGVSTPAPGFPQFLQLFGKKILCEKLKQHIAFNQFIKEKKQNKTSREYGKG